MKKIGLLVASLVLTFQAQAIDVASGKVKNFAVGVGNFGVKIEATSSSRCPSGWFYVLQADMDIDSWKSLQALSLAAFMSETPITLYAAEAKCNEGTSSRFTAATAWK